MKAILVLISVACVTWGAYHLGVRFGTWEARRARRGSGRLARMVDDEGDER